MRGMRCSGVISLPLPLGQDEGMVSLRERMDITIQGISYEIQTIP